MKPSKQKIQEYFLMKPARAVDVLFSQNKIDQVQQFYASLQQYKKSNTIALRQTLQNNYEKMLYCTELLDKVKKHANLVKDVASQIQQQMNNSNKIKNKQVRQQTAAQKIQSLLRNYNFVQAIKLCNQSIAAPNATATDKYYLNYMKIEIINKMERHICANKLNQVKLLEYVHTLQQFIFKTNKHKQQLNIRHKISKWVKDFGQKSIMNILSTKMEKLSQLSHLKQCHIALYQIIFQFKLKTLRNKYKNLFDSTYFEEYFDQLGVIIKIYKEFNSKNSVSLSCIFNDSAAQIKSQLASIFIQRAPTGQIVFKNQLYEKLLTSQKFQQNLQKFYKQISDNQSNVIEHPFKFIKQLWRDYFINLIDLSLEQANPLPRVSSLKHHSTGHDHLPSQLKIFLHDYSLQQSLHIINEYEDKISLLMKNLLPIIKKSNRQQLTLFNQKFNNKIKQISQKFKHFIKDEIIVIGSVLRFRKLFLLRIISGVIQKQIKLLNTNYSLQLVQNWLTHGFQEIDFSAFWSGFMSEQEDSVVQALIYFDSFFIGYCQGVNDQYKDVVSEAICQFAMKMLLYVQKQAIGRQKDLLTHTIQSLKHKKQKVTILQTIVVPYLAQKIFSIQMKPISIQKSLFERRLTCKPKKATGSQKMQQQQQIVDQFEIGDKEQRVEFVQVNNIGKSIINLGNNIITGFMKKK